MFNFTDNCHNDVKEDLENLNELFNDIAVHFNFRFDLTCTIEPNYRGENPYIKVELTVKNESLSLKYSVTYQKRAGEENCLCAKVKACMLDAVHSVILSEGG